MTTTRIRQISCRIAKVYKREEDGIVVVDVTHEEVVELDDYKEIVEAIRMIGENRKQFVFVKMHPKALPSVDARNYINNPDSGRYTFAQAFLVSSLAQRIIGNFVINVQRPILPTRLFSTEQEAIRWLRSLV